MPSMADPEQRKQQKLLNDIEVIHMDSAVNYRYIGQRLKEARKKRHLTQAAVAEQLGIHPNSYGNFERAAENISLSMLLRCCTVLDIRPGDLLNDCTPDLQKQYLSPIALQNAEMQELLILLNQCTDPMIHQLLVGLRAIQQDQRAHEGRVDSSDEQ